MLPQVWTPLRYIDFTLLLVFHSGRSSPPRRALCLGWLAGLAEDLTLSNLYPLGLQATTKMITGLLASVLTRFFNMEKLLFQTALIFILGFLNNCMVMGIFSIFGQTCPLQSWTDMTFSAAFTALVNIAVYPAHLGDGHSSTE